MKGLQKKKEKRKEKSGVEKAQSDYQREKSRKGDTSLDIKSKKK